MFRLILSLLLLFSFCSSAIGAELIFRDNFDNSSIDSAWQVVTANAGTVVEGATGIDLDSPAAVDASAIIYKTAFDKTAERTVSLKWIPNSAAPDNNFSIQVYDAASVPAVAVDSATYSANRHIAVTTEVSNIIFQYFDLGGTQRRWNNATSQWALAGGIAHIGFSTGVIYRTELESDVTRWRLTLYDASDTLLTQTSWITWASTRTTNTSWIMLGDIRNTAVSQDIKYTQFIITGTKEVLNTHLGYKHMTFDR